MSLIVMKFGGSSVADKARIEHVAGLIADEYNTGHDVVVILSAQGNTTDELMEKAAQISASPPPRELDMLLSVGEQISIALMAMQLSKMGLSTVSLLGWQAGIRTNTRHGSARIDCIDGQRIRTELSRRRIVLLAGFQGIDQYGDVTTLGRGGSDTTAVAVAAALHADECRIYTDVDGVYEADPRKYPDVKKYDTITYDHMLTLAQSGAQVLHDRSVQMAKRYSVKLEVLSSFTSGSGTLVCE